MCFPFATRAIQLTDIKTGMRSVNEIPIKEVLTSNKTARIESGGSPAYNLSAVMRVWNMAPGHIALKVPCQSVTPPGG